MKRISIMGDWEMGYVGSDAYDSKELPSVKYYPIKNAVPGYWEDMLDAFRSHPIHNDLAYNPLYTLQRYPQAGSVPDMALPNVLGTFAYKRTFTLPEDISGGAYLYCGGAHNTLSLWINDVYVGRHEGYSSEFTIDIPLGVLTPGENTVVITVSNNRQAGYMERPISGCTARAANECTGGIYGDLEIIISKSGLRDVRVSTARDLKSFTVFAVGDVKCALSVAVFDGNTCIREGVIPEGECSVSFDTEGMRLWSVEEPYRYTVKVTSGDTVASREFGLRRLTSEGMRLFLNGRPFMFRAICEHGYYPITVHPTREKNYYRAVIRRLKELGFNAIRFHTWVPMKEYMEAADEMGVLIEVETPNNTTYREWCDIVDYTSKYTSVVMYSSGNEMVIDEDYIEHLRACAALVHGRTDSLFSPMSAMRGIEYHSWGDCKVEEPFPHNPKRLEIISEFCDVYNTYSRGGTSYRSVGEGGDPEYLDRCNAIYSRPLLSHEICINGTYIDLSLKDRYRTSRIGDTELFTSVEKHLADKGLLERAPRYYLNSVEWQRRIRKHCFEVCRRAESFAGYDYLGDIDHHWHTFGYCVGMMNEFYELKGSETVENVRRYNGDAVLLADLPRCVNYTAGERVSIPILVSNYGEDIPRATLRLRVVAAGHVYERREIRVSDVRAGEITSLYTLSFNMPRTDKPIGLKLVVELNGGNTDINNEWELYVFPKAKPRVPTKKQQAECGVIFAEDMSREELLSALADGKSVVLFSAGPFARLDNSFQISIAGRTNSHLATVIADHPLLSDFPHSGFCSWQFREMMTDSHTAALDLPSAEFMPIIEAASSYKNARREAMLFEYRALGGRLLVSTLNLNESDPAALWLKARIIEYACSAEFAPKATLTPYELSELTSSGPIFTGENTNAAFNANDITMRAMKVKR